MAALPPLVPVGTTFPPQAGPLWILCNVPHIFKEKRRADSPHREKSQAVTEGMCCMYFKRAPGEVSLFTSALQGGGKGLIIMAPIILKGAPATAVSG